MKDTPNTINGFLTGIAQLALCFAVSMLIVTPQQGRATAVTFGAGADDYISLTIGGNLVAVYDNYPAGGATGTFDMTPGTWYDISIDYKNRWGTDGMSLTWNQPGDVFVTGYGFPGMQSALVPKAAFRSYDNQGNLIGGLTGQYYDLSGNLQSTVYGEGPLNAINDVYQNQQVGSWNGYGYWSQFEERLTGQIQLVPEPSTVALLALGSLALLWRRRS